LPGTRLPIDTSGEVRCPFDFHAGKG